MATLSPMLTLPPELLLRISTYLTTPQLGCFRQSCKGVETALFKDFAKEFFTKRQFMIEHVSLQALVDIANYPTLSQRLSEVIISTHTFASNPMHISQIDNACYEAEYVSRDVLLQTGKARDMLVEAFSKLPHLRTVGLRDYNGRGRLRDGEDAQWRSYGWSFGLGSPEDAHQHDTHLSTRLGCPETIFPVLLHALGQANARPQKIEVFLRKDRKLKPQSFSVVDGFMGQAIKPMLANIKTLMLTITSGEHMSFVNPLVTVDPDNMLYRPLKRFLHHTPALETLRLNFDAFENFAEPILKWLGETTSSSSTGVDAKTAVVPSASLPNLKTFDLGMLTVSAPTLIKVITKFDLKSTSLWKVTLSCKDKDEYMQDPNRWAVFSDALSDALPASTRLKHVLIGFPTQSYYTASGQRSALSVSFAADGNPDNLKKANLQDQVTHRGGYGSSVKQWLNDLAGRTCVPNRSVASLTDSSDMSDEDEDLDESEEIVDDEDEDV